MSESDNEKYKLDLLKLIKSNRDALNNPHTRQWINFNPDYENDLISWYKKDIEIINKKIQIVLLELSAYVYWIRELIPDITASNPICGIYTTLCSCLESFKSIAILWDWWYYQEIMTINRKIEEAKTQCEIFIYDMNDGINTNFEKWLTWSIISHSTWRKKSANVYSSADFDIESMKNYTYRMESNISHNGYIWMLEMLSPFSLNYDIEGSTRLYRTIWWIELSVEKLKSFCILLKMVYLYILKDNKKYDQLDLILLKYFPDIWKSDIPENVKKDFPKI